MTSGVASRANKPAASRGFGYLDWYLALTLGFTRAMWSVVVALGRDPLGFLAVFPYALGAAAMLLIARRRRATEGVLSVSPTSPALWAPPAAALGVLPGAAAACPAPVVGGSPRSRLRGTGRRRVGEDRRLRPPLPRGRTPQRGAGQARLRPAAPALGADRRFLGARDGVGGVAPPAVLIEGTYQALIGLLSVGFALYPLTLYPQACLLGFSYEDLRGRVGGAVLMHFAHNVSSTLFGLRSDRALLAYAVLADAGTVHLLWRPSGPGEQRTERE